MSIKENLPPELSSIAFETITKKGRCLFCNDPNYNGEFLKLKVPANDYEILAPVCQKCIDIMKQKQPKKDIHPHPLQIVFHNRYGCDVGHELFLSCLSFCCKECNYDACLECYYDCHPPAHEKFKEIDFEEEKMDFDKTIEENSNLPTIVDFNADWCGPCRALKPLLLKEAKKNGYVMISVNVDKNRGLSGKFKVQGIPQVLLFLNGKESFKFVGFNLEKM